MHLDPEQLSVRDMYQWMIHTILPRPIAWISTLDAKGRTNLAPFSFFMGVCAKPPTLMFCPVNDRFGKPKDTLANVEATGEFVVNLVPTRLCEAMNRTAASLPHGESEFERFNIAPQPSSIVAAPRVLGSPVSFECRLDRIVRISEGPAGGNAVFGRIVALHVDDLVLGENGFPDLTRLDLVARAGGDVYLHGGETLRMERPE
jgi:flavin reductase (DIM6/NTAB) family NADH-FMN oxidoreductase RutF